MDGQNPNPQASPDPNSYEARYAQFYKDCHAKLFGIRYPDKFFEDPEDWQRLGALIALCVTKARTVEDLEKELKEVKAKNRESTANYEKQLREKDARLETLRTVLKSNYHYKENLELKEIIAELETDLKWYREREENRSVLDAFGELDIKNSKSKKLKKRDSKCIRKSEGVEIPDEATYSERVESDGDWDLVEDDEDW